MKFNGAWFVLIFSCSICKGIVAIAPANSNTGSGDGSEDQDPMERGRNQQGVSGDPHFTIPLMTNETLCYSIQGYAGLAFNLISNPHLTVNAFFIDSVNDSTEATWIGKLAIIPNNMIKAQPIIFDSTKQEVYLPNQGSFKAAVIRQIKIQENGRINIRFTKGLVAKQGPMANLIKISHQQLKAKFDVTFHLDHLDVDWKIQDKLIPHSHGLMGQFMTKGVTIDRVKQILIRPDHPPVPVTLGSTWNYNTLSNNTTPCWHAKNHGSQGDGLIEGKVLDYIVNSVEQKEFIFKKK